jgi:hypothetical protein
VPNLPRPYGRALADEDSGVRREALLAAAWAREPWVLDYCSKLARRPSSENWDAILLLAILGQPSHLQQMLALGKLSELGPKRFRALGAYGHPGVVTVLLEAIESKDPLTAVNAGAAFMKITGAYVISDVVAAVQIEDGPGASDPSEDVPDEVILPSAKVAHEHWAQAKAKLSKGTRWCRGFDVSKDVTDEVLAQLDLESRWEACLRGRFQGTWRGSLIDLERFPQKRR